MGDGELQQRLNLALKQQGRKHGSFINIETVREVVAAAKRDFPLDKFEYTQPHDYTLEQYRTRYDELAHIILEILKWRTTYFGDAE